VAASFLPLLSPNGIIINISHERWQKMKSIAAFLLLFLFWTPVNVIASDELQALKQKESIDKLYEQAVEFFTVKMPEAFEKRLNNSYRYIDLVTDIFMEKGIPLDIAYLPLIESEFSPHSVGPGDTVGLWQFVKITARQYGLRIDNYVDERKDPIKSTYAAADYLRELHLKFGAWDIALAAYNAGEGKVMRMLNKNRSVGLPTVVKRYLAYFMAASTVAQDPERYGFGTNDGAEDTDTEYINVTMVKATSLKNVAKEFHTTVDAIKQLNPALLADKTPPYPYLIRLPNN
jgi:membrane-bound lytic murein transglycosylase D